MKFYLIVAKGNKQGMPIPVTIDLFLVGSDKICQLRKDGLGSRHCAFITRDRKVFVQDLNSGSETIVNGSAIPVGGEWPLHAGDRVVIGPLEFLVQVRETAMSQKDLEEWAMQSLDIHKEKEEDEGDQSKYASAASAAGSILSKISAVKGTIKGRLRIGMEKGTTTIRFNDPKMVEQSEIALIKKELSENCSKPNMRVLLDLKNIRKLSTQGAMMLAEVSRLLRSKGSTMALCRVRADIEAAMDILRIENIKSFNDRDVALNDRW